MAQWIMRLTMNQKEGGVDYRHTEHPSKEIGEGSPQDDGVLAECQVQRTGNKYKWKHYDSREKMY